MFINYTVLTSPGMILQVGHVSFHLAELQYFTNLGFPEIAGVPFPLLKSPPFGACEVGYHIIDPQVVDRHLLFSNFERGPNDTFPNREGKVGRRNPALCVCVCVCVCVCGSALWIYPRTSNSHHED